MLEVAAGTEDRKPAAVPAEILEARQCLASALHRLMIALAGVTATGTTVEIASGLTAAMRLAEMCNEQVERTEALIARAATMANSAAG